MGCYTLIPYIQTYVVKFFVNLDSSFFSKRMCIRCCISGFITEIETYFSPDIKSTTGNRAAFTDSRTMVSCHVGVNFVVFFYHLKPYIWLHLVQESVRSSCVAIPT